MNKAKPYYNNNLNPASSYYINNESTLEINSPITTKYYQSSGILDYKKIDLLI